MPTEACKLETQQAFKYEGEAAMVASFKVLGSVATHGLMSHPDVNNFMGDFTKYIDEQKLEGVLGVRK